MKRIISSIGCCALALAMVAMSMPALGQAPDNQKPSDQQQQSQPQQPSSETSVGSQSTAQTFQGTISQTANGYVLKDSTGASYQLDDQKQAKDYVGQSVKVTGTLDSSTNMIRVVSIAPAS